MAFVPGYDRFVVTASTDRPNVYAYEDLAIGHYDKDLPLENGCRQVVATWWDEWAKDEPERRWQYFWDAGLIDKNIANRWAISVLGPSDDDFMVADTASGFWEQNAAVVTRDSLIEYAVKNEIIWALHDLLERRGWLDDE